MTAAGASSSGQLEAAGPSSSGRLVEDPSNTSERKVYLQSNSDGTSGSSMILRRLSRRGAKKTNFTVTYLTVLVRYLVNILIISKMSFYISGSGANSLATACGHSLQRITKTSNGWQTMKDSPGRKI